MLGLISYPSAGRAGLLERLVVRQRVIVQEEPGGDVEGDEHVDGVMLVSGKYEEDPEHVQQPGEGVKKVHSPVRVLGYEEVEQREGNSVTREHVVPARPHSLQTQPRAAPDLERLPELLHQVTTGVLRSQYYSRQCNYLASSH